MKRAIVFPGQGSQAVGMGKELAKQFFAARQVFEEVDEAVKQKLSLIMFEGPEEELLLTENAQPAIMAASIALLRVMEKETGFSASAYGHYFAGHSLGEYTALTAAGSLSLHDTARLLKLRGREMQKAVPVGKGAMAALLGLEFDQVTDIVKEASRIGICAVANDNSYGQIVVSGLKEAVDNALVIAKAKGAKRAVLLPVSAPFHCALMEPAAVAMKAALADTVINIPSLPIVSNVTAEAVRSPETIRELLVTQVTAVVRWKESVEYMKRQGVSEIMEIGFGKILTGLIKRIDKEINAFCISSKEEVQNFSRVECYSA